MDAAATTRELRLDRTCFAAAFALTIGWFLVYDHFRPDYLVDESGHIGDIYHLLEGKPGWPEQMTMLPGYHFIVAALWQLHPPIKLLTLARLVSTVFALAGLVAFASAWRCIHRNPTGVPGGKFVEPIGRGCPPTDGQRSAGRATLLFALLPLLQPFTGMAYTDAPALALVLVAFAAHLAGHRPLAAVVFAAAACVRQTSLVWAAFVVAWEWSRPDASRAEFLHRTRWLFLVLGVGAAIVAVTGRLTLGHLTGTALGPNIANLHFAAILALLLGFPVWLAHTPAAMRRWREAGRARPIRTGAIFLGALTAAAALGATFANPHVWNRELSWPDASFTLLRNWPLVWIDSHPVLRSLSGLDIVAMAVAVIVTVARQPRARELWLSLAAGALLPFGNNLVEPRYFIPGVAFCLLFIEVDTVDWRRLAAWWALLCVLHAPFIALGLSLW